MTEEEAGQYPEGSLWRVIWGVSEDGSATRLWAALEHSLSKHIGSILWVYLESAMRTVVGRSLAGTLWDSIFDD